MTESAVREEKGQVQEENGDWTTQRTTRLQAKPKTTSLVSQSTPIGERIWFHTLGSRCSILQASLNDIGAMVHDGKKANLFICSTLIMVVPGFLSTYILKHV